MKHGSGERVETLLWAQWGQQWGQRGHPVLCPLDTEVLIQLTSTSYEGACSQPEFNPWYP